MSAEQYVFVAITFGCALVNAIVMFGLHHRIDQLEALLSDRGVI